MTTRYESFMITEVGRDGGMVGHTEDGKQREFFLVINRDLVTNELTIHVGRHFTDPQSIPFHEDSEPWTAEETRGQV